MITASVLSASHALLTRSFTQKSLNEVSGCAKQVRGAGPRPSQLVIFASRELGNSGHKTRVTPPPDWSEPDCSGLTTSLLWDLRHMTQSL